MLGKRRKNKNERKLKNAWTSFRDKVRELNKKGKGIPGDILDIVLGTYFPGYPIIRKMLGKLLEDESVDPEVRDELVPQLEEILQFEHLVNDRHKTDMNSDSWLSKNIRPMTLGFLLLFTGTVSILNSIFVPNNIMKLIESTKLDMKVDISMLKGADRAFFYMPEYLVDKWMDWTGIAIAFYFGLRGAMHLVNAYKTNPDK